jgi:hypothetical protein
MRIRLPRGALVCWALGALLSVSSAGAAPTESGGARELSLWEHTALSRGERVERPLDFTTKEGSYTGGVSYQVVRESPDAVLAALLSAENLPAMLPRTRSARVISADASGRRIEVEQGTPPFSARYTIVVFNDVPRGEVRFWLDRRFSHDVADVWGFFRVRPFGSGRSLLTVGAAVDLGPIWFRGFVEGRVRALVLGSVTGIRDFVEPRRLSAVGY